MSRENRLRTALSLLPTLGILLAGPAAGQDYDAMAKWTAAKVVHYKIVGEFTGKMVILQGTYTLRNAAVTDHIEFEFDWDNQEMALLGKPVLRNTPTKLGAIDGGPWMECPPLRIEEAAEFATVTRVTAQFVLLQIELKQQTGKGAIPWTGNKAAGKCGDEWDPASPSDEMLEVQLQLPPGMMLAMSAVSTGYDFSKDGKSFLTKPENGWSWVITPSIVR